jgi:hypothetical protein
MIITDRRSAHQTEYLIIAVFHHQHITLTALLIVFFADSPIGWLIAATDPGFQKVTLTIRLYIRSIFVLKPSVKKRVFIEPDVTLHRCNPGSEFVF